METGILKTKKRLIEKIKSNMSIDEVIEWIWEEYGVKVRNWDQAERFLMKKEVKLNEIMTLIIENDIEITDEDLKELL